MAVVTDISERAEEVLRKLNIRFEYGYGDAYHFQGIPGKSSVDIKSTFTLQGISFIVKGERLLLVDELPAPAIKAGDLVEVTATAKVISIDGERCMLLLHGESVPFLISQCKLIPG